MRPCLLYIVSNPKGVSSFGVKDYYKMGLFLLLLLLAFPSNSKAQELDLTELKDYESILDSIALADSLAEVNPPKVKDTLEYQAKELSFDNNSKIFSLIDQASIEYQGATLSGDSVYYDIKNKSVLAAGEPILKDQSNPAIHGKRMKYNFKKKVGQIFYGSSWRTKEQFNGTDIRRLPDGRLLISRGDFTTCDETDESSFFFYSRRMVVEPGKSVTARPVVLNVAEVPIAILPLLIHPLQEERRSGLLTPKYGGDQAKGFYLENFGYYWAISDYMDFKNSGDLIEGERGTFNQSSLHSHFRYKNRYTLDGDIRADYYIEDFASDE